MNYCINGRQPKSILEKADEIKMRFSDQDKIIEYIDEFPNKTFILNVPKEETELNWQLYKTYVEKANFILCLENLHLAQECRNRNLQFYWAFPCFTWYELRSLLALKPYYVILGAPLSFDLEKVSKILDTTKIRLCPNLAYDAYIPKQNGIYGAWIRPEDIQFYEEYVNSIEFEYQDFKQEAALLKVYKEDKQWPGNLNLLITNLNYNIDNRVIDKDLGKKRMNCGQRCMENGTCHLCESCFTLGTAIRKRHFQESFDS